MIMQAEILSNGSLKCLAPPYTSPEILTVDVTFNGIEYTNDKVKFGLEDLDNAVTVEGSSTYNFNSATFIRLGDT